MPARSLSPGRHRDSVGLLVVELTDGVVCVRVSGRLQDAAVPELAEALREATAKAPLTVVDLRGVGACDTSGVQALLAADDQARALERRLVLVPARAAVHRAFVLAGAERRLTFVGTPEESRAGRLLAGVTGPLEPILSERFECLTECRHKVNEALRRGRGDGGPHAYLCECGLLGCTALFDMSAAAYAAARRDPRRRAIIAEHQIRGSDIVVVREGDCRIVEDR